MRTISIKNKKNIPLKSISDHFATTNTHYCQPLTPTATTHHNQPPLMPRTTSIHHCNNSPWQEWGASVVGGSDGWQQLMGPVGGGDGWLG